MKHLPRSVAAPAAMLVLTAAPLLGCTAPGPARPVVVAEADAEHAPRYGVGDSLGHVMFARVAAAPQASPAHEVLAIAQAEPTPAFDWMNRYLSLTR